MKGFHILGYSGNTGGDHGDARMVEVVENKINSLTKVIHSKIHLIKYRKGFVRFEQSLFSFEK